MKKKTVNKLGSYKKMILESVFDDESISNVIFIYLRYFLKLGKVTKVSQKPVRNLRISDVSLKIRKEAK